jgi:hypothetical protein
MEFGAPDFSQDEGFPQQVWDDLYESAFDALGDSAVNFFDE